mgnify:CR=1 FL=1
MPEGHRFRNARNPVSRPITDRPAIDCGPVSARCIPPMPPNPDRCRRRPGAPRRHQDVRRLHRGGREANVGKSESQKPKFEGSSKSKQQMAGVDYLPPATMFSIFGFPFGKICDDSIFGFGRFRFSDLRLFDGRISDFSISGFLTFGFWICGFAALLTCVDFECSL